MTAPATPHIPVTSSVVAPWNPRIGERCVVTSTKDWASDWADPAGRPLQLWVAGVVAMAGGGVNVTVSDEWPIKARPFYQGGGTDLTDGFIVGVDGEQDDLAPLDAPEAADIITAYEKALENGADALASVSKWRTDSHAHDADMGHELRDFDSEDWDMVEGFAKREADKLRESRP